MTMSETTDSWESLAEQLHEEGGVDKRRAQIVALVATTDMTYQEIADELGTSSKGSVGNQVRAYREDKSAAEWLADNGPDV